MTRQEAIEIMNRWGAPGYAFDSGHEFGSFAKDNPRWWVALVRATVGRRPAGRRKR